MDFVIVGGLAGVAHGFSYVTEDVDVCAPLNPSNVRKIILALRGLSPCFRMTPHRRPLPDTPEGLAGFKSLYLVADWGQVDFLSEITGAGGYNDVLRQSIALDIEGLEYRVLSIDALIQAKRALGRPKDLRVDLELEAIRRRLWPDEG